MATVPDGKAKTARRIVEVLEFFDDRHRSATVMDIVRRYNRPQSSTSELLASLVDLGLLYKDAASRSYTLTPRAAILGSLSQPRLVRDGTLSTLIDRLVAQTGLGVALLGMVGLNAQVFRWTAGTRYQPTDLGDLMGGAQHRLCGSAAGRLLLTTLKPERREGVLRRLNAEAPEAERFDRAALSRQLDEMAQRGTATGPAGFGGTGNMAAVLMPADYDERPLVLGFVYQPGRAIDPAGLADVLQSAVRRSVPADSAAPQTISTAA